MEQYCITFRNPFYKFSTSSLFNVSFNTQILRETTLDSIESFFDIFSNIAYAEDVTTSLQIRKINKFVGWINIIALQKLLYFVFDKSSKEEEDRAVTRPQKIVLPLKNKMVDGEIIRMKKENYVSTTLMQSKLQEGLWEVIQYCSNF